jgi:hypothetical protein
LIDDAPQAARRLAEAALAPRRQGPLRIVRPAAAVAVFSNGVSDEI